MSTFKKSVLSIIILSAVTGSFISWDKYQPRHETKTMVEFYQSREFVKNGVLLQSMVSNDSETLARIAEENLVAEAELIALEIAESSYSPEADEPYDYELEDEKLAMWQEEEESSEANVNVAPADMSIEGQILFSFDSSKIEADYFPVLNKAAQLMQDGRIQQDHIWQVVGYADLSGNYIYNSKLAKKRAQAVTEYLVNKGVNEEQLVIVSLGASQPLSSERTVENNRIERRVEIHDYQTDVALLSEQFNVQLAQEIKKTKKKPVSLIKTAPIEVKATVNSDQVIPTREIDFRQQKRQKLTTVMEF